MERQVFKTSLYFHNKVTYKLCQSLNQIGRVAFAQVLGPQNDGNIHTEKPFFERPYKPFFGAEGFTTDISAETQHRKLSGDVSHFVGSYFNK